VNLSLSQTPRRTVAADLLWSKAGVIPQVRTQASVDARPCFQRARPMKPDNRARCDT
jgi:hypothetical protein